MVLAASIAWASSTLVAVSFAQQAPEGAAELRRVWQIVRGLDRVAAYADATPQAFARTDVSQPWLDEDRLLARDAWIVAVDDILALDVAAARGARAAKSGKAGSGARKPEFAAGFAAWMGKYRWLDAWIKRCDRDPRLARLLDEPLPEEGLAAGTYTRWKTRFEELKRQGAFPAVAALYGPLGLKAEFNRELTPYDAVAADRAIEEDMKTLGAGFSSYRKGEFRLSWWSEPGASPAGALPLSSSSGAVCSREWLELDAQLEPGDILLIRTDPFWGDVGATGWWNSAALVVSPRRSGECAPRVLMSSDGGMRLAALPLAASRFVAALRPRRAKRERNIAAQRAYRFIGKPYGFGLDLDDESGFSGPTMIYRAYGGGDENARWPVAEVLSRRVLPANGFARAYDDEFGLGSQQFDLAWFAGADGKPRSLEEFRKTWRWPKWILAASSAPDRLPAEASKTGRRP